MNLLKTLKVISKVAVPLIGLVIYKWESKNPQREYSNKNNHDLFNISTALISNISGALIKKQTNKLFIKAEEANIGLLNNLELSDIFKTISSILIIDFYMYNWHKLNHKSSLLWAFHRFHHKDPSLDASSGIRFHPLEMIFSEIFRAIFLIPLGINQKQIENYQKILIPVIIFHHSNIKINNRIDQLIKNIIVTPGFHRIHHSIIKENAQSNYGSVFSFWDKLFNSYTKNEAENYIVFGL